MFRLTSFTATALIFLIVSGSQPSYGGEAYWPGWLGPKRDGWVSDFRPPTPWPEQLRQAWLVEVGTGYGSPLVAGDRVYQHARQGDDEVVWCIDLNTGEVKWRQSYAVPFKIGGGAERHGKGPKSSPVMAGGRVFTMSITGVLSAWDTNSGELLWRSNYGSRFEKSHPYWGASTSPIVDGKHVIVHFGTDEQGALVALDVESGKEVWSLGNDGPSYSSPLVVEIDGVRQIVEWNHRALVGVESKSGRLLWEYPFPHVGTDQNMPTPAFHNGCVLLGGENRGIHSVEPRLNRDVDGGAWSVNERWHQDKVALDMSSAVVNGDLLYGFSHYGAGRLFCLDTETGEIRWQGPGRTGDNVTFLSIPGYIVALIDDGELKIIAANGDRSETVASYHVSDSETWAPPVLLENGFLVKDSRTLSFWSLSGSTARSTAPSDDISSESFDRARKQLHTAIENGEVAGGTHLVARRGKTVYFEAAGLCDIEDKRPFRPDTIVRIYSMTKPITSVAAMTLFEQGKFQLDDPVAKFVPAFATTTVLKSDGDSVTVVPARRQITVRDVFRHTTGYSYGDGNPSPREYYEREGMRYRAPAGMLPPKMSLLPIQTVIRH